MKKPLTLGSLFDGIGGFCLAGQYAGIEPVWASEIEPFPMRVTEVKFPSVTQLGDVHAIHGGDAPPVDIITFGSPCQNLSIAGKRAGLEGSQSSLFFEAIRIITEMREKTNGQYPRYAVWENVPGALSSNHGNDYRQVLESLAQIKDQSTNVPMPENGKWHGAGEIMGNDYSLAWRILDASKGWGVAQRRRRIFLVADLAGTSAGEILFESEGVSGYTPSRTEARQGTARCAETCACASGFDGYNGSLTRNVSATLGVNCGMSTGRNGIVLNDQGGERMDITDDISCTLRAEAHHPPCVMEAAGFCTEHSANSRGIGYAEEESPTLRAGVTPGVAIEFNPSDSRVKLKEDGICQTITARCGTGGNNVPLTLTEPKAYGISSDQSHAMLSENPHSGIYEATTCRTLDCNGGSPVCNQGGIAVVESYALQGSMIGRKDENGPQGDGVNKDVSFTLNTIDRHAVYAVTTGDYTSIGEEEAPPLMARDWKDPPVVGIIDAPSYSIDRAYFNAGENAKFDVNIHEEIAPSIIARGPSAVAGRTVSGKETFGTLEASMSSKQWLGNQEAFSGDYHVMRPDYKVRRLTPLECCRLQGYPDNWMEYLSLDAPKQADIDRWRERFAVWDSIQGRKKPRTDKEIIRWLKQPYTDAAAYKAYGNSVAVPCVFFVLTGIVWANEKEETP